jgi:hypothetical protein
MLVWDMQQPRMRWFVPANQKESRSVQMWLASCQEIARLALRECRIDLRPSVLNAEILLR